MKVKMVWVPEAPNRVPEERELLGGSGGMPPEEIFENETLADAI